MSQLPGINALLILPRLRVQNANALSSPMTHGFPAISAFLGLMWSLERELGETYTSFFNGVGVVCHQHAEQTDGRFNKTFRLTRNPVGKDGKTAAIVEEGRIHLDISLVFGLSTELVSEEAEIHAEFATTVGHAVANKRIAGGTLLPSSQPWRKPALHLIGEQAQDAEHLSRQLRRQLLPGFALVCRDDLLEQHHHEMQKIHAQTDLLDAWLDLSRINWAPQRIPAKKEGAPDTIEWQASSKPGWLVPIPVGFGALDDLHAPGSVANARDDRTPLRFVESLYSIGQWVSPHRLQDLRQLLWYPDNNPETGLYRANNDFVALDPQQP